MEAVKSGGIVAVWQNGMGIGTFGPMLNKKGNSVGGVRLRQSKAVLVRKCR